MASLQILQNAIKCILDKRHQDALNSQYDVAVCLKSVDVARQGFESIPLAGTPEEYSHTVLTILSKLVDEFYDGSGEYTSKGLIGDIYLDVSQYIETQIPDPLAHIDKTEARRVLIQEMAQLIDALQT